MKCQNCNFWLEYQDNSGVCWRTDEPTKSIDLCVHYIPIRGKKEFTKKVIKVPLDKCELKMGGVYIDIKFLKDPV